MGATSCKRGKYLVHDHTNQHKRVILKGATLDAFRVN